MSKDIVGITKLDGGYLISHPDSETNALRVTWYEAAFLIKNWLDNPPKAKSKPSYADLFGFKECGNGNVIYPKPDWVDELIENK